VIHNPHDPQVGDMAVLESLNPEVRTLALLQTTRESTYLRWGKANLGREIKEIIIYTQIPSSPESSHISCYEVVKKICSDVSSLQSTR
jgi:hypothetical protein